ncbi:hypothetical protein [Pseudonocardia humida]|uniref:PhoD-like phosphatase n=1 Tax=Pseudonocardia humida TaxID=2800819 RepID=A0ABT1A995_9PSEU|nr:hypothetical protein [Pseudonocardia humida]MCO1659611.1 hypothetical protein [Pseudonocardia humida]
MRATSQQPSATGPHPVQRAQFAVGEFVERQYRRVLGAVARLRGGGRSGGQAPLPLAPGTLLVQKDAGQSWVVVWIGAVVQSLDVEDVPVQIVVRRPGGERSVRVVLRRYCIDGERSESGLPADLRFLHGQVMVPDLDPATGYEVALVAGPLHPAEPIRARTLPRELEPGRPLRLFAASCYDADTDARDALDAAFGSVFADEAPDLTLLLGDQVYADAPAWRYALMSRHTPRTGLLLKYWRTWGMQPDPDGHARRGLRGVLGSGPTYFLPDDHEFWNNWPNRTVTAKHSYGNIWSALVNGHRRRRAVVPDTIGPAVKEPFDPRVPPSDPLQQSYLPVHPGEWDAWGLASFELFGSFQASGMRALSRGERDDQLPAGPPEPGTENRIHRPRHPVLQLIDIDPLTIALLDTRTRRTRRVRHPYHSAFVDPEFLDRMLDAAERAPVFVLALSQPVLQPAAWLGNHGRRERFSLLGDTGMQDYWHQYQRFWTELVRRRAGRPTVTLGGDIHQSYVAVTESTRLNLVEVVASPMSLVSGGGWLPVLSRAAAVPTGRDEPSYRPGTEVVRLRDLVAGPRDPGVELDGAAWSLGCLPKNRPGFAGLAVERIGADAVRLDVRIFDRDAVAATAESGTAPTATVRQSFRLDFGERPGVHPLTTAGPALPAAAPDRLPTP